MSQSKYNGNLYSFVRLNQSKWELSKNGDVVATEEYKNDLLEAALNGKFE